jgi:type II secretory pathway pseudopilin PulG
MRRVSSLAKCRWQKGRRRASRNRRARPAYTFIEILIVTAIIGILVALLLPAVQAAREAARRMTCSNNLLQLAAALQEYEMAHGVYPPGTVNDSGPIRSEPVGYHHNWIAQILPFLEERNAYRHIDRSTGVYAPENRAVRRVAIPVLRCPTMPYWNRGYSDYAAMHSDYETPIDADNSGSFFLNSQIGNQDLVDGSSQTLFLGEKRSLVGDLGWMSGTRATLRNAGIPLNWNPNRFRYWPHFPQGPPPGVGDDESDQRQSKLSDEELMNLLIGAADYPSNEFQPQGGAWGYAPDEAVYGGDEYIEDLGTGMYREDDYGMAEGMDDDWFQPFRRPEDVALAVGGFASLHPGGAQFTCGDGSTRFISETIDSRVYAQLANRRDRRLSSGDF